MSFTTLDTILIFAGGELVAQAFNEELPVPDYVIAADSGALNATRLGYEPDLIVGDLDSLPADLPTTGIDVIHHPADKDATDLELAFELALHREPRRIVLVGAEGGRFDHEIGAMAVLCSDRWQSVPEIDWVRQGATCSVVRGRRQLHGDLNSLVSLVALGGDASGVTTEGLRWPMSNETLFYGSSRGLSNRIIGSEFLVSVTKGTVLAILVNDTGGPLGN